jgi:hypothetical protein
VQHSSSSSSPVPTCNMIYSDSPFLTKSQEIRKALEAETPHVYPFPLTHFKYELAPHVVIGNKPESP